MTARMQQGVACIMGQFILRANPGRSPRTSSKAPRSFLLGGVASVRLRDVVFAALVKESVTLRESVTVVDLSAYPDWLLVLGGTLVVALVVWLLITLLKWTLWLLFFGVLIGGLAWAGWLLWQ